MKQLLLVILLILLLCVACAPTAGEVVTAVPTRSQIIEVESVEIETVKPTVEATAVSEPTEVVEPTVAAVSSLPAGTLWLSTHEMNHEWLHPIDPATGEDVPGYEPIDLGSGGGWHAFSPDGRTLATLSPTGQLHLVDLVQWQGTFTELRFHDPQAITFLPDGKRLAIGHGWREPELVLVDVANQNVIAETSVDFTPRSLFVSPDGERIVQYGVALPTNPNATEDVGPSHTAVFNTADLSQVWETALPEVLDGMICSPNCGDWQHPPLFWMPAVVFSPDGRFLYIVHADSDTLTTLDLEAETVASIPIAPEQTWLEQLLALTARVAHAKGGNETIRTAVISPDGSRLYITGFHSDATEEVNGERVYTDEVISEPLPLQVVDTATGTILAASKVWGSQLTYLPSDKTSQEDLLVLHGWRINGAQTGSDYWTDVVSVADLSVVAHVDNYELYPQTPAVWTAIHWQNNGADIALVDPATFTIQTERHIRDGWWLRP